MNHAGLDWFLSVRRINVLRCFLIAVCVNFLAFKYFVLVLAAESFLTLCKPCTVAHQASLSIGFFM